MMMLMNGKVMKCMELIIIMNNNNTYINTLINNSNNKTLSMF